MMDRGSLGQEQGQGPGRVPGRYVVASWAAALGKAPQGGCSRPKRQMHSQGLQHGGDTGRSQGSPFLTPHPYGVLTAFFGC